MNRGTRRFFMAFLLTMLIALTAAGGLVAYDRMERTVNGAPEAEIGRLVLGSRSYPFDMRQADHIIVTFRRAANHIGGPFLVFSELLDGTAAWICGLFS